MNFTILLGKMERNNYVTVYIDNLTIPIELFSIVVNFLDYYPSTQMSLTLTSKALYLYIYSDQLCTRCANEKNNIKLLSKNCYLLETISDQTYNLCFETVKKNGYALRYVKYQIPEICMEAVKQNGYALKYVKHQTPEICMKAVKQNGDALSYVKYQTPEICMEAVKQNGHALIYVDNKTEEICDAAITKNI